MRERIISTLVVLCFSGIFCFGQINTEKLFEEIERFILSQRKYLDVPRIDLAVVYSDSILKTSSFGDTVEDANRFYLGSVSKSLTALGVMKLVELYKFDLDARVDNLIRGLSFSGAENPVTLRHLLNHTSGLTRRDGFRSLPGLDQMEKDGFELKLAFEPGTQHHYSNLNYVILGLVIKRVSGMPYCDFMRSFVFQPLGMEHTKCDGEVEDNGLINHYQYWFGVPFLSRQMRYASEAVPAGFIRSTARDMSQYLLSQLIRSEGMGIVPDSLLQIMQTVWNKEAFGYCMGWKADQINGMGFLQHLGSTANSYGGIFIIPEREMGFVLLMNSNTMDFGEGLMKGVLQIISGQAPEAVGRKEFFLRLGAGLIILYLIIRFVIGLIKVWRNPSANKRKKALQALGINLFLLVGLILVFPLVAQIPLATLISIHPDFGLAIVLSFVFGVLLSLVKLIAPFMMK